MEENFNPFLIFGFKKGGHLIEKVRYSPGDAPIELFIGKSEDINDLYNGQMQVEEIFRIFNKDNSINRLNNNGDEASVKLRKRCTSYVIKDDLENYYVLVNSQKKLLKYYLNNPKETSTSTTTTEASSWLDEYDHFDREAEVRHDIEDNGFYIFFATNGKETITDISINYVVLNPGHEHLSVDLIPNKVTYLIFFITWVFVLIAGSMVIGYRVLKRQTLSYLSILILFSYIIITCYLLLRYIYWRLFSGFGKVNLYFEGFLNLLEVCTMMMYLVIINLVSSGYKIVTDSFSGGRFIKNLVVMFLIVFTSLFLQYKSFFLLIFLVVEVIIMVVFLHVDIKCGIGKLNEINEELNPIFVEERKMKDSNDFKIKYYKAFKIYLIIYFFIEVTVLCLKPFLALYHEWIFVLVHQIISLVSMTYLFITLTYSVQFIKFQGLADGALVAPNPYFENRGLKICGEIIAIKSDIEDEKFCINLGIESDQGIKEKNLEKNYINHRAKVYETEINGIGNRVDNSVSQMFSNRNLSGEIEDRYNIGSMIQNIQEESKEETKAGNAVNDPERGIDATKFPRMEYLDLDPNLFESQNVKDFRKKSGKSSGLPNSWITSREGIGSWIFKTIQIYSMN